MRARVKGGDKAAEFMKRQKRRMKGKRNVAVGFPSGEVSGHNLNKAVWQEFGTSRGIPERPFMRGSVSKNKGKYKKQMTAAAKAITNGGLTMELAMDQLGAVAAGDIQAEIVALQDPPNAPSTIAKKGSSNPLIDTGAMRQSVTWKVR